MDQEVPEITFIAAISQTASALKFTGNGQGAKVQFDIPETDLLAALKLTQFREMALEITIRVAQQANQE